MVFLLFSLPATAQEYWETADAHRGQKYFERCMACHTVNRGGHHKVGPNLYGIWGKKAGSESTYNRYSPAMKQADAIWDYYTLDAYLGNSKVFIPRNRMACGRISNPQERADLILYLYSLSASE